MAMLNEIATRLSALSALSTYSIKKGHRPDAPDKVVSLYETGGAGADLGFGTPGIQFEHPGIQVLVRGAADDYEGPRAAIQAIYLDLPKVQGASLSGTAYHTILPVQTPFVLERDEKRRVVFAVNFNVEKEP